MIAKTSARNNILARIRSQSKPISASALPIPSPPSTGSNSAPRAELEALRVAAREHIAQHERGPLPSFAKHDPIQHFITECERVKTTLNEVALMSDVPQEVARYLATLAEAQKQIVGWPEFAALDWQSVGVTYENRPAIGSDLIGLTGCFCAIGETGTLLLLGARATPKVTALLPETHICVVKKSRIVPTMEDAFQLMRDELGEPPRSTFFVSGPSRTADIEQTIVIGAHGPYRVHVILVP